MPTKPCQVKLCKKSNVAKAGPAKDPVPGNFVLVDNQDDTLTVNGVDAANNPVDISAVATLAITSDNPAVLTVDAPTGMTSAMHTVGPVGSANLTATATWNDGSIGPFSFTLPVGVQAGPAGGVVIVPGTPTSR